MSKIMLVEDSPTVSKAVESLLTANGYEVHAVMDGLSALVTMCNLEPDLIILDIRLQHVDGFELVRLIRNTTQLAETPILMMSALTGEESIQRALDTGANDYLTKPVDEKQLLKVITEQLNKA